MVDAIPFQKIWAAIWGVETLLLLLVCPAVVDIFSGAYLSLFVRLSC